MSTIRPVYMKLLLFAYLALIVSAETTVARDKPGPVYKRDSMMVYPEALKRVPVALQVSAWAVSHEIMNRGLVVDPTMAMLSGAINPFCLHDLTVIITDDSTQIEFYVDSLCARRNPNDTLEYYPDSVLDTLQSPFNDMRVQVVSSSLKPKKFYWPQNKRLEGATIRAIYRISFADKGDMGFQELFGRYNADELLMFDSTRAVIMR